MRAVRRTDIDILRAIAVLSVVLFHFDVPGFSGGFLGVDIFFVISGYLISSHILRDVNAGQFSFLSFYARRFRRLAPALAVTLFFTALAAIIILPKPLLLEFNGSIIASAAYVSNIYFFTQADYFDIDNILKPLLHTWSLGIEEQFYLVWPAFLLLATRWRVGTLILLVGFISLVAADIVYDHSPTAAFFLLPFRVFEFAIGAAICFAPSLDRDPGARSVAVVVSLVVIAASVFLIDETWRMPGVISVPVCLAVGAIIAAEHPVLNSAAWPASILARIGLVSYSAYLVHWPLVVFYKIYHPGDLPIGLVPVFLVATYLLAEALFRCIEKPGQMISLEGRRWLAIGSLPAMMTGAVVFVVLSVLPSRFSNPGTQSVRALLDAIPSRQTEIRKVEADLKAREQAATQIRTWTILVIGDSHAHDMSLALRKQFIEDDVKIVLMHHLCDPLAGEALTVDTPTLYSTHPQAQPRKPGHCDPYHRNFLKTIAGHEPELILFSEDWRPDAVPFLKDSLMSLRRHTDAEILVFGKNVIFLPDITVAFREIETATDLNRMGWQLRSRWFDAHEQKIELSARAAGVNFISKYSIVCPDQRCEIVIDGQLGYSDASHWSDIGLSHYGARIVDHPLFRRALQGKRN